MNHYEFVGDPSKYSTTLVKNKVYQENFEEVTDYPVKRLAELFSKDWKETIVIENKSSRSIRSMRKEV